MLVAMNTPLKMVIFWLEERDQVPIHNNLFPPSHALFYSQKHP